MPCAMKSDRTPGTVGQDGEDVGQADGADFGQTLGHFLDVNGLAHHYGLRVPHAEFFTVLLFVKSHKK